MFVSGLSVSEFVLLPRLTVVGLVADSFVYPIQEIYYPSASQKMKAETRFRTRLLRASYDRMQQQAKKLGASGIIDWHSTERMLTEHIGERSAQGTAVCLEEPRPSEKLFACTFSAKDYFLLTAAGFQPLGVVLGVCVYYQKLHQRVQQEVDRQQNTERSDFTRGLYTARKDAMLALEAEAAALEAAGVIGITVTAKRTLNRQRGESQGMLIEFTAIGTAITTAGEAFKTGVVAGVPLC